MQFWAINIFCNYKLHWAFKCYLLMVRDLLSPAMKLVGSLLIWRIYLFILAKNEAVVCNGCVFLECHLLADTNKKEKQWSTESTLWCLLWCLFFFTHCSEIWFRSSECSYSNSWKLWGRALCLCRVVAVMCSKALDPCTGNYILPVKITKSSWATHVQAEQCFPELLQATQYSSRYFC